MNRVNEFTKIISTLKLKALPVIIILLILIFGLFGTYTIKTGEVGIVSTFGKVSQITDPGLHFKIPFIQGLIKMEVRDRVYYFNRSDEHIDTSLMVSTKDMQTINLEISVQANIVDPKVLYTAFQGRHETRFVNQRVKEITQSNISKYTIEEFISKRTELSKHIYQDLKKDFESYGMLVTNVSLTNHSFSHEYEKAIEKKKVAEQDVERMKFEQEKIKVEAEAKVILAQYKLQEKELQAQANKVESASLTPELLKKQTIEKWNGELPKVQGSATPLINLN